MKAEILCVGTELLMGDTVNTNAAFIAKELQHIGIGCYYQMVVGDNPQRLRQCLENSLSRADIVITTGGLGPTYDDLTKETVAEHFGLEMELHQPSLDAIHAFGRRINRAMTPNNEKQAWMPKGAVVFPNDRGTAPGLAVEGRGKVVVLLPGPPREMTAMFLNQVRPYLLKKSDTRLVSHNIHMFGVGESQVAHELQELMEKNQNPTIAPYAKEGELLLRVTASAQNEEEGEALTRPVVEKICRQFERNVYGVDTDSLENTLVQELKGRGKTIGVAESCTGGFVAKRITDIAGSSQVFGCGMCTYSNEMKRKLLGVSQETLDAHGAVSEQTALEMARGVRAQAGADYGLSITGIAGPDGGTEEKPVGLVYIAACHEGGEKCIELKLSRGYGGERAFIRNLAASNALYLALRAVQGLLD